MGLAMPANAQTTTPMTGTPMGGRVALYASAGKQLVHFDLDAANAALVARTAVTLPENVQYAWPHPSRRALYVASSNGPDNDRHFVTAFRIDSATGALAPAGDPVTCR
jgi:6-phosphogluconolactonase (cycloisomerase 2 family)